jgi:hypothetical protein
MSSSTSHVILACIFAAASAAVAGAQSVTEQSIKLSGTASFPESSALTAASPAALPPDKLTDKLTRVAPKPNLAAARRNASKAAAMSDLALAAITLTTPLPYSKSVVGAVPNFFGFSGLTQFDSRNASNGNQFTIEPPDQGLAVGNGVVFETINDVYALYDSTTGLRLTSPIAANAFFKLPPAIVRSKVPVYGPSLTDPRVYFDHELQRWFVTTLELDTDPATGNETGRSHLYLAVSTSANPLLGFKVFTIDVTDDGSNGTPAHPGCPCLGDQPLLGADRWGLYISTNEFSTFGSGFNGAQIYALSKNFLAEGGLPTVAHFSGLPLAGNVAYSVQPALSLGFDSEPASGIEYFLSSLDFSGTLDNRIAVWAMLNTDTLNELHPKPVLIQKVITTEVYGMPPPAIQPAGPMPLGASLNEPLETIDTNDDRMNQVVYENGYLWGAVNTVIGSKHRRTGIACFIVKPTVDGESLNATVQRQDYIAAPGDDSVMYPSIGATPSGRAAITFTLVGPSSSPAFTSSDVFYPSMAFTTLSVYRGTGPIQLGAAGSAPEDGFSGYVAYGGNGTARWGDYSAAIADTDNSIWMAAEWIPNSPRTSLANWGTFIGQLQ